MPRARGRIPCIQGALPRAFGAARHFVAFPALGLPGLQEPSSHGAVGVGATLGT